MSNETTENTNDYIETQSRFFQNTDDSKILDWSESENEQFKIEIVSVD